MRYFIIKTLFLALFFLPNLGWAAELTVITTTDFHGGFHSKKVKTKVGEELRLGGAAMLSSYISHIKALSKNPVILLDVGDSFQGSLESNSLEGAPVIDLFNYLGYDALTIGNHEFDFGPTGPQRFATGDENPLGSLKDRISQAHFPFLAINIIDKEGNLLDGVQPSTIIHRGGVKVGVIGAISPDAGHNTFPPNVKGLSFPDPTELIIQEARLLRTKKKVDFVILSYHAGEKCTDNSPNTDISTCSQKALFPLIDKLPKGLIDLIVGGDEHELLAKNYNGVGVLQAGYKARGLAWAKLSTDQKPELHITEVCDRSFMDEASQGRTCNKSLAKKYKGQLQDHLFLGQSMTPDPLVTAMVEKQARRVNKLKSKKSLAYLKDEFTTSRTEESPVGNWFTDMLNQAFSLSGIDVDIVVHNNGGLRNPIGPEPVTFGDIFGILPFDDNLVTITVTGTQLRNFASATVGGYSYSGLTFKLNDQCEVTEMKVEGEDIKADASYTIATNDFLAYGGLNFDQMLGFSLSEAHIHYNKPVLRDIVFSYLNKFEDEVTMSSSEFYQPNQPRQNTPLHCRENSAH